MVASSPRSQDERRGGDSDEVRRGDAMGREFFGEATSGATCCVARFPRKHVRPLGLWGCERTANQGRSTSGSEGMTNQGWSVRAQG
jgi:hypothetical protein